MDHHFHLKAPSWVTCRQRRGCTTRPKRFVNGSILRSRAADRTSSTNETGKLCAGFHRSRLRTRQRTNRAGEGYSDPSHSCLILGPTNDWLWPHCWIRAYADITMAPRRPSVQTVALWKLWRVTEGLSSRSFFLGLDPIMIANIPPRDATNAMRGA
jgi:hypothetical protein